MEEALLYWSSKKQCTISTSTTKAGYIALGHASREGVWIRCFLNYMELCESTELIMNGDNESSLALTKNYKAQNQTRHIDV